MNNEALETEELQKLLGDWDDPKSLMAVVAGALQDMEDAEQVIAEEIAANKGQAELINSIFVACRRPAELPRQAPRNLYRLHVRQLIRKLLAGERLDTPTHVECVCMGLLLSERGPLQPRFYDWLLSDQETSAAFGVPATQCDRHDAEIWLAYAEDAYRSIHADERQMAYENRYRKEADHET